jgi:hypothetical protein
MLGFVDLLMLMEVLGLQFQLIRLHGCRVRVYWYIDQTSLTTLEHMSNVLGFGNIEKKKLTETSFKSSIPGTSYGLITRSAWACKLMQDYFTKYPLHK